MGKEIGIDFGTTNTVVSYYNKKDRLRQLKYEGKSIIPSVIYFKSKEDILIGSAAKKKLQFLKNGAGVDNFKPQIGNSERVEIVTEDGETLRLRYREIAAYFLNQVIHGVEEKLLREFGPDEGCLDRAVVTVPAMFNDKERSATKRAVKEAGIQEVKLVAEPTAAAVAYEEDRNEHTPNATVLVYDFGGGTFDVSIIQENHGQFKEIARGGRKDLGGNDLTEKIFNKLWQDFNKQYGLELPIEDDEFDEDYYHFSVDDYRKNKMELWEGANNLKEDLSEVDEAETTLNVFTAPGESELYTVSLSRDELNQLIEPEIDETVQSTLKTMDEARDRGVTEVDQVVLAGGSSNIPLVSEKVGEALQSQDVMYGDNVSTLISRGAAIFAKQYKDIDSLTQPITNVDLGVIVTDGVQYQKFNTIIPAGTDLPCQKSCKFRLLRDGQQKLEINYYERDCKNYPRASRVGDDGIELIDTLVIDSLPAGLKKNDVTIEVTFCAQKDGTLDMDVALTDPQGHVISQGAMKYQKKSDFE